MTTGRPAADASTLLHSSRPTSSRHTGKNTLAAHGDDAAGAHLEVHDGPVLAR
jgi:hypothetical protein